MTTDEEWDNLYYEWREREYPFVYANKGCEWWSDDEWRRQWPGSAFKTEWIENCGSRMQEIYPRWVCGHRGVIYVQNKDELNRYIKNKCVRCQEKDKWIMEQKRKVMIDKIEEMWESIIVFMIL